MQATFNRARDNAFTSYVWIIIGAVIHALSVVIFLAPFDVAPSGISGIAVILNRTIDTPIGIVTLILNIPIIYLGYRMLPGGWRVVVKTLVALVVFSVMVDVMSQIFPPEDVPALIGDDVLLNAIFGGIIGGIGGGLVFREGGTFAGNSTLALILQRRTGIPMSNTFLYTDVVIILLVGGVFGWLQALYAAVALFLNGVAADYIMEGGPSVIRTAMIVTDKPDALRTVILFDLDRGGTSWQANGLYTGDERTVIYISMSRSQVRELRRAIMQTDPDAFMVIGQGHNAYGRGFRQHW